MKDWFMNIDEVQLITFSPTCTSKQVGEAIVHGTGISSVSKVDLTLEAAGKREVPSHALAVITVPVYGGHVAPLALERMKELHADGAPAVVVVVYGNRAYEKALVELDAFVTRLGFKVIAGATFVGEHVRMRTTWSMQSFLVKRYVLKLRRPKIWRNCMGWM